MKRRSFKANTRSDPKEILSVFHFVADSSVSGSDLVLLESQLKFHHADTNGFSNPASVLAEKMFGYRSSICLGLPSNLQIDSCEWVFAAWGRFFFIFSAQRGTTNNITKTHTQFCFVVITHNTLSAMEISGSLQGPGYQVLLFHLLMQTVPEQKRMLGGGGVKKRQWGCFCPLVKPATLSTMTAGDRAWP